MVQIRNGPEPRRSDGATVRGPHVPPIAYPRGMESLGPLDWIVVAAYGAVVLGIGWWVNRRQRDSEDYFLGGRRMRWWVVGVSLVATSFSSVSLVGGTGFGFKTGLAWLQLQIGDLLALLVVMAIFLPFFSSLRLTTAYEYLERRFGVVARTTASGLFLGQTVLRAAVLVYSAAVAIAAMTGVSIESAIVLAAAAAVVYSAFGGIGAVVWTDLIQMVVVVASVLLCIALVAEDVPGGLGAVLDHARDSGRLEAVTVGADARTPFNLLGALVPYAVLALALFGTGQQAVQRFLSVRDLRSARRVAITGWAVGTVALAVTLFLGVCIAAWAALAPAGAGFAPPTANDVLPHFALARLRGGLAGILLAGILAAAMSSLDSAIHSMSTVTIVDFWRRFARRPPAPRTELLLARLGTVGFGALAVAGAFEAAEARATILETLVTWLGYFAGPLLGLFLLGIVTRRTEEVGALAGVGLAFVGVAVVVVAGWLPRWGVHPLWLAPASFVVTVVVGRLVSELRPAPSRVRLAGLTLGRG
jgi:SSS family solute:Na+ symporter